MLLSAADVCVAIRKLTAGGELKPPYIKIKSLKSIADYVLCVIDISAGVTRVKPVQCTVASREWGMLAQTLAGWMSHGDHRYMCMTPATHTGLWFSSHMDTMHTMKHARDLPNVSVNCVNMLS